MFNVGDIVKYVNINTSSIFTLGMEFLVVGIDAGDDTYDIQVDSIDNANLTGYWSRSRDFELVTANPFAPNPIPDAFYSLNSKKEAICKLVVNYPIDHELSINKLFEEKDKIFEIINLLEKEIKSN